MKILCQTCGIEGYLQHIGKNYYRVRHYTGCINGKPEFMYHKQSLQYIQIALKQNKGKSIDHIDPKTIDPNLLDKLKNSFFNENESWAGRSAWNDRHVGIVEAAGSNPVPSTTCEPCLSGLILNVVRRSRS